MGASYYGLHKIDFQDICLLWIHLWFQGDTKPQLILPLPMEGAQKLAQRGSLQTGRLRTWNLTRNHKRFTHLCASVSLF